MTLLGLVAIGSGYAISEMNATRKLPSGSAVRSLPQQISATETRLMAGDARANDFFGRAVALSGDTLVVGANGADSETAGRRSGAAYVFQWNGSAWIEQARLTARDAEAGDEFGYAVAIDGDIVAVGAHFKHSPSGGNGAGAVYVFARRGDRWDEQAKLTTTDGAPFDLFGHAVAVSGDTLAVGARGANDPSGARNAGAVYVFQRSSQTWTQQARLTAGDAGAVDHFGHAVAIGGDTIVTGAYGHDGGAGKNSGAVYVFRRSGETWSEQARLTASDARAYAQFGYAVALDGDTLVVGANQDSDTVANDPMSIYRDGGTAGAVYVFQRNGDSWSEQAKLAVGGSEEYGFLGQAVALSRQATGDAIVAVGGWGLQAVHLYQHGQTGWSELLTLKPGKFPGPVSVEAVASSGDTVVVGARWYQAPYTGVDLSGAGAAYVFDLIAGP
jgi:hypothetical protein